MTELDATTLTCNRCGTSFSTRAKSAGTRCKGCGTSVYVPVAVRQINQDWYELKDDRPWADEDAACPDVNQSGAGAIALLVAAAVLAGRWLWKARNPPEQTTKDEDT
jgi:DNA-directed RNA polymerase subunit RPC12/RpoP